MIHPLRHFLFLFLLMALGQAAFAQSSISINNGALFVKDTQVTLRLSDIGRREMMISNDFFFEDGAAWQSFKSTLQWTLSDVDGEKDVFVKFRNTDGTESEIFSATTNLDRTPPLDPYVEIGDGNYITTHSGIPITLEAKQASHVIVSNREDFVNAKWIPYKKLLNWEFPPQDGTYMLYVKFKDRANNETEVVTDRVKLDTQPPSLGEVKIYTEGSVIDPETDLKYCNRNLTAIDLEIFAEEAKFMRISNSSSFTGVKWQFYEDYYEGWKLTENLLGNYQVYIQFRDIAGNESRIYSDRIIVDTHPPIAPSIRIDADEFINQREVPLIISCRDALEMQLSESPQFDSAKWQPYKEDVLWEFSEKNGEKTIYARFKDLPGNITYVVESSILLDSKNPEAVLLELNGGEKITINPYCDARIQAFGAVFMQISDRSDFLGAGWQYYDETPFRLTFPADKEEHVFYARFKDEAGNLSGVVSDTVEVEVFPARTKIEIDHDHRYLNHPEGAVEVEPYAVDAIEMMISNREGFEGAEWEPYSTAKQWTLDNAEDGEKFVFARFKSKTGGISETEFDQILLDRKAPTGPSLELNRGVERISDPFFIATVNAYDAYFMQLSEYEDFTGANWLVYNEAPFQYNLRSIRPGKHVVFARFKDMAGNVTEPVADTVLLTIEPTRMMLTINDDEEITNDPEKEVALRIFARHAHEMMISNFTDFREGKWEPYQQQKKWILEGGDGLKQVFVKFRSITETESEFATDAIRLDRTAPNNLNLVLNNGKESVYTLSVLAQAEADGAAYMKVSNKKNLENVRWVGYTPAASLVDFPADDKGLLYVYAQFKDAAGNVSDTLARTVLLEELATEVNVSIHGNIEYLKETDREIILLLNATNASQMMVSNDPYFAGANWQPYQKKLIWQLTEEDGEKTVYTKFRSITEEETDVYTTKVTLDTTPPQHLKLTINDGKSTTFNHYVNVTAFGRYGSAMKIGTYPDLRDATWEKYNTNPRSITFMPGSGYRTVYLQMMDRAGNVSEIISDSVLLELPVLRGSVMIDGGATYNNHPNKRVILDLFAINAKEMRIGDDPSFTNSRWEPFAKRKEWTLGGDDGNKNVFIEFRSRTLTEAKPVSDEIILDRIPPENAQVLINGGDRRTLDPEVNVTIKASGADFMQVSTREDFVGAVWRRYTEASLPFILSSGGGEKKVYVRLKDQAGNISAVTIQSIILEITPVRSNIEINNQLEYANDPDRWVTLSLFSVHAKEMLISNNPDYAGASWQPYKRRLRWQLSEPDGYKKVYVIFRSVTGTESKVTMDEIVLDRKYPSLGRITINGGSTRTQSPVINVTPKAIGASKMQISAFEDFRDARWVPYVETSVEVSLNKRGGRQKAYARFKDAAGNVTPTISSTILLQIKPIAGSMIIDNDRPTTSSPDKKVALQLIARDAKYMMISNYEDFQDGRWIPYKRHYDWELTDGDGAKHVYAKFRSETGDESNAIHGTILLDRNAPEQAYFTINEGEKSTLSSQLEIYAFAKGATDIQLSTYSDFKDARWQKYENRPFKFVVESDIGKKDVYVRFRDISGNISETLHQSILLEETPTTGALTIDNGKPFCSDPERMVNLSFTSQNIAEMMISNGEFFEGAKWQPFQSKVQWQLAEPDGSKKVYVRLKSSSGIVSETISSQIHLDRKVPYDCDIIVDNGRKSTIETIATVESRAKDALFMRIGTQPTFLGSIWVTYDTKPVQVKLSPEPGKKTIYAQFRDQAGNVSPIVKKDIVLEVTPVSIKVELNEGTEYCTDPDRKVDLNLVAKYATEMIIGNDELFSGSKWQPYKSKTDWQLSQGDGVKTVYVKYRNNSGIESKQKFGRILLDLTPPTETNINISKANISDVLYPNDVQISLTAKGAAFMQVSEKATFDDARWIPYTNMPFNQTLGAGPGDVKVYARFRDKAGNISNPINTTTSIAPKRDANNVVIINNGSTYTYSADVFLNLISKEADQMRVSDQPLTNEEWIPYSFVQDFTLKGEDGIKQIYAQFKTDDGGETASVTSQIILDRTPPSEASITVAEGKYCTQRMVTLQLVATEATKMLLSNTKSFTDATWVKFRNTVENWQLENEDGEKRIYAMFSDEAGNRTEPMYVEVILDRVGPSDESVIINNRAMFTNQPGVSLALHIENATEMIITNDGNFESGEWQRIGSPKAWALDDSGDGEKTVYVKFRNEAGIESAVVTDKIMLDTNPPVVSLYEAQLNDFGDGKHEVVLTIEADDAKFMRISTDGRFKNLPWEPYFRTKKLSIEGHGAIRYHVQLKDAAGNVSTRYTTQIELN